MGSRAFLELLYNASESGRESTLLLAMLCYGMSLRNLLRTKYLAKDVLLFQQRLPTVPVFADLVKRKHADVLSGKPRSLFVDRKDSRFVGNDKNKDRPPMSWAASHDINALFS